LIIVFTFSLRYYATIFTFHWFRHCYYAITLPLIRIDFAITFIFISFNTFITPLYCHYLYIFHYEMLHFHCFFSL
jgi:hypothetical protein